MKDSFHSYLINGQSDAVNPQRMGTKLAAHYCVTVAPGACQKIQLRLSDQVPTSFAGAKAVGGSPFGVAFDTIFKARKSEADEYYAWLTPESLTDDQANIFRQALAGMLWTKQFYFYDVDRWLEERGSDPFNPNRKAAPRNDQWHHMYNGDVI